MPTTIVRTALIGLMFAGTAAPAQQLSPNAGAFSGEGQLNDHDGNNGTWQASGTLRAGRFSGTLSIILGGKALTVRLQPGPAYLENGSCILKGENGRNRVELRGKCDRAAFGPGTISGYFDQDRAFDGEFSGRLAWGGAASVSKESMLPSARLSCGYRERVGGVVAGQLASYESRPSLMGFLSLTPAGLYRTQNGTGGFHRNGDAIRFTTGRYAGALGRLRADNSGESAVYFSLDENRRANGTPIVDPWSTFCVHTR
jgi:hypothetical protein